MHCDNQGVSVSQRIWPIFHGRTKHVDVRLYSIIEVISEGLVKIKVYTTNNRADMLTQSTPHSKFQHYLNSIKIQQEDPHLVVEIG